MRSSAARLRTLALCGARSRRSGRRCASCWPSGARQAQEEAPDWPQEEWAPFRGDGRRGAGRAARRRARPEGGAGAHRPIRRMPSSAWRLWRGSSDRSPYSPVAYLLMRGLRWGELRANGVSLDECLLEAPPTEVRQKLKKLAADGLWEEVLATAETAMELPCGRGWLDLQRYVVRACENLGGRYDPIALAVRAEVRTLLRTFLSSGPPPWRTIPHGQPGDPGLARRTGTAQAVEPAAYSAPPPAPPQPEQAPQAVDAYDPPWRRCARGGLRTLSRF